MMPKEHRKAGHKERVCFFTIAIAQALGLYSEQIRVIASGAYLHDIGKMAIPDSILRKPGMPTPEETAIMQEHCYKGYQMVKKFPHLVPEPAEIVYAHHERYDGTGYPRGLKGKQILIRARITAVANTLDSITTDLPYRSARSVKAARAEIERWSGRQFDPEIVKVFLEIPDRIFEDLRNSDLQEP